MVENRIYLMYNDSAIKFNMIYDSSFKEMDEEIQRDEMKYLYFEGICVYISNYYNFKVLIILIRFYYKSVRSCIFYLKKYPAFSRTVAFSKRLKYI